LPDLARTFLISCEYESPFSIRTGNHIEERSGMVNFSVVGRNASLYERKQYADFDEENKERIKIAEAFNMMFPDLQATVGGETGIDIAPRGADKSQILRDFKEEDTIHFFGDAMFEGGNDYSLKKALWKRGNSSTHQVSDWKSTWELLV
jgi:phosphomannomutase